MRFLRLFLVLTLACCSGCGSHGGKETRVLPSGDTLTNSYRLVGGGLLGEHTRPATLSIRWNDSSSSEVITEWYDTLSSSQNLQLYSNARNHALVIGKYLFYRERSSPAKWNQWFLGSTPKLYSYIRSFVDRSHAGSYAIRKDSVEYIVVDIDESKYEHGRAIRPDGGWLPYEISAVNFEDSHIIGTLIEQSRVLPRKLVFSSVNDRFGNWTLDEALTDQANNIK